jgi:hypothetical protein
MSFALICVPDGLFFLITLLFFLFMVVFAGACITVAIYATMGLAKWAAARHNRLAANEK